MHISNAYYYRHSCSFVCISSRCVSNQLVWSASAVNAVALDQTHIECACFRWKWLGNMVCPVGDRARPNRGLLSNIPQCSTLLIGFCVCGRFKLTSSRAPTLTTAFFWKRICWGRWIASVPGPNRLLSSRSAAVTVPKPRRQGPYVFSFIYFRGFIAVRDMCVSVCPICLGRTYILADVTPDNMYVYMHWPRTF